MAARPAFRARSWPSCLITAAGIAASLGIIAATFPLLSRITGPEVAKND
jgi:hypothetical protein